MKYKKAANNHFRLARVEYRNIFTGMEVVDAFDVGWAGVTDSLKRNIPMARRSSSNFKRQVVDNWKREYRSAKWGNWWSGVDS
jgi:hypothetical protein